MDKEERKDGKDKKKENESTNKKVKKSYMRRVSWIGRTIPLTSKKFPASQIGLNTFLYVNALATESLPYNHGSSLTHSPLNNT